MRRPPVPCAGAGVLGTALQGACRGEAWRRGGENACDRVLASRVRRSLCYPAQKEGGVALMLTKAWGGEGRSAGRLAASSGGGPRRNVRRG